MSSFCSAKATHIFSAKNIGILCIESAKTVNEMTLNELIKLTMPEQLGPGFLRHLMCNAKKAKTGISKCLLKCLPCKQC